MKRKKKDQVLKGNTGSAQEAAGKPRVSKAAGGSLDGTIGFFA